MASGVRAMGGLHDAQLGLIGFSARTADHGRDPSQGRRPGLVRHEPKAVQQFDFIHGQDVRVFLGIGWADGVFGHVRDPFGGCGVEHKSNSR